MADADKPLRCTYGPCAWLATNAEVMRQHENGHRAFNRWNGDRSVDSLLEELYKAQKPHAIAAVYHQSGQQPVSTVSAIKLPPSPELTHLQVKIVQKPASATDTAEPTSETAVYVASKFTVEPTAEAADAREPAKKSFGESTGTNFAADALSTTSTTVTKTVPGAIVTLCAITAASETCDPRDRITEGLSTWYELPAPNYGFMRSAQLAPKKRFRAAEPTAHMTGAGYTALVGNRYPAALHDTTTEVGNVPNAISSHPPELCAGRLTVSRSGQTERRNIELMVQ